MCSETFTDESKVLDHQKNTHRFPCTQCDGNFTSQPGFDKHVGEKHAVQSPECNLDLPDNTELEQHKKASHPTNEILIEKERCSICDVSFDAKDDKEKHMQLEHMIQCNGCEANFKTRSQMMVHKDEDHTFKCKSCKATTHTQEDLNEHIAMSHTFQCPSCETTFCESAELDVHKADTHPNMCVTCYIELKDKEDLARHIEDCHTYTCDVCGYMAISEDIMENHILAKHARPDSDGEYKCEDCSYQCKDKTDFGKHFKENHGSKAKNVVVETNGNKPNEEYRILKNNFDRLESMYKDNLEEFDKVKSEYEARLIKANDDYDVVKSENEVLKEKVDVLFKLGRSYINNSRKVNKTEHINVQAAQEDEIEVLPNEEDADNLEDLQAWSVNKMRGFKRVTPASNPTPKERVPPVNPKTVKVNGTQERAPAPTPAPAPPTQTTRQDTTATTLTSTATVVENRNEIQYCHYFVNRGSCRFEERTGLKCRFEHSVAPMCTFGSSCTRHKCMYSHPKLTAPNNTFLGQRVPMMNPWQLPMMNPWMQNSQTQFSPNPWNNQINQRNQ